MQNESRTAQNLPYEFQQVLSGLNSALLADAKSYGWFSTPVDFVKLGIHDYLDVVRNPMDLGTVHSRLIAGVYDTIHACVKDIKQVWTNARTYHGKASPVTLAAERLEGIFEESYRNAQNYLESVPINQEETFAVVLRSDPVGCDRLGRQYYW